jgi:DNA-directed RNA polymerase subunit F
MIISKKPLALAEVSVIVGEPEDKKLIHSYLKKFAKLSKIEADKLINEIKALNNPKLKEEHIIKIADFLPHDLEDVNKVLTDAGLSEAEANAIIEITKKY